MLRGADETEPYSNVAASFARRFCLPIAASCVAAVVAAGILAPVDAQLLALDAKINFNIPTQTLSQALVAYGAATGLEVFYNASLAEKQHSEEVVGLMTPTVALQMLLRGTGYVAKTTGPGAFTIMPASREASASPAVAAAARRRLEPYFAAIQAGISDALCRNTGLPSARHELVFQFWIAPSGVIERVEVVGDNGERADDQTFAAPIRGLALVAPPTGMPQPINMVIFPPSNTSRACGPVQTQRGAD